ncbi:MAG: tRNA pseudouridine(38-40) synthase TruA [Bryobacterales bacterium]|nr:tRNA pseudouridine(38-40) synthase TruA [Bryobacterales bacterium]
MKTWKLVLEYDGSRYSGWQEQINARTVMGEVRKAAETVLGLRVELQGAGRTDAGVHAEQQVAHLRAAVRSQVHPLQLLRQMNDELPYDIAILAITEAAPRFHARHDAVSRTYRYQIATRKSAFDKKFIWWVKEPLDVAKMAQAARLLIGRHDFVAFRQRDPAGVEGSTIVVVENATLDVEEGLIEFRIEASHFLYKMVRRLVGALVKIGLGEFDIADFARLIEGRPDRRFDVAAWTAPSSGLFLEKVTYAASASNEPQWKPAPKTAKHTR